MSDYDDLGPFADITHITRMPDGALLAFDKDDTLIAELDENGVHQIRAILPHIKLIEPGSTAGLDVSNTTGTTKWLSPVKVKTTGPVFLGFRTCPTEVDGQHLRKGDRVLVTDQPDPKDNGLYTVWRTDLPEGAGGNTAGHSWLKADDYLESGSAVLVSEGQTHQSEMWVYDAKSAVWGHVGGVTIDPVADALALLGPPDPKTHPDWPKTTDGTPLMTLDEALEDDEEDIDIDLLMGLLG